MVIILFFNKIFFLIKYFFSFLTQKIKVIYPKKKHAKNWKFHPKFIQIKASKRNSPSRKVHSKHKFHKRRLLKNTNGRFSIHIEYFRRPIRKFAVFLSPKIVFFNIKFKFIFNNFQIENSDLNSQAYNSFWRAIQWLVLTIEAA